MRLRFLLSLLIGLLVSFTSWAQPQVTVGVITDGPLSQSVVPIELLQQEINDLMGSEFTVTLPDDKNVNGGWTLGGVRQALNQLLADPEVDMIIALGLVSSQEAAHVPELNKPVIATVVIDQDLQGFPYDPDTTASGKDNLVYLTSFKNFSEELDTFYDMIEFNNLALVVNDLWLEALPQIRSLIAQREANEKINITLVEASSNINTTLARIPASSDAVYLAPLLCLSEDDVQALAEQFIVRRLPSFSSLGQHDVELGILAAMGGLPDDKIRFTRRIALNMQSILLGDLASELTVVFDESPKLTINMRTARAIGFAPQWRYFLEAELLHVDDEIPGKDLTLLDTLHLALTQNLDLQASELFIAIAAENIDLTRAALLPQLVSEIRNEQIDDDRAALTPGIAENTTTGSLVGQQQIYADSSWANYRIAQYLKLSEDYGFQVDALDILQFAATAYLNVLRAQAIEDVLRANLDVTEVNLELARVRERIGYSSRADLLRWESQIAIDQQDLLSAHAFTQQSLVELLRLLNLPQNEAVDLTDEGLGQLIDLVRTDTFQDYIDNAYGWQIFQNYSVEQALLHAPEIEQINAVSLAKDREILSNQRAFYLPDFNLEAGVNQTLSRSGAGSNFSAAGLDDTTWLVGVNATLPLFTGGGRSAQLSQSRYELQQLGYQTDSIEDQVEARTRNALYAIGDSFPAIGLSEEAARAAQENLDLVTDRYAQGTADITDLVDAQNNALTAGLAAAESRYTFLIDFIALLRSTSDLAYVLDDGNMQLWFERLEYYYDSRGY